MVAETRGLKMIRKILGVVFGIIVAGLAVAGGEFILAAIWPMPIGGGMPDAVAMKTFMANVPLGMKIGLAVVYAVATFFGAAVASNAARGRWAGWVITTLMLMATVANFVMLPHPVWLVALCLIGIVLAGGGGTKMGSKRQV
jgi:hypothetical protein